MTDITSLVRNGPIWVATRIVLRDELEVLGVRHPFDVGVEPGDIGPYRLGRRRQKDLDPDVRHQGRLGAVPSLPRPRIPSRDPW